MYPRDIIDPTDLVTRVRALCSRSLCRTTNGSGLRIGIFQEESRFFCFAKTSTIVERRRRGRMGQSSRGRRNELPGDCVKGGMTERLRNLVEARMLSLGHDDGVGRWFGSFPRVVLRKVHTSHASFHLISSSVFLLCWHEALYPWSLIRRLYTTYYSFAARICCKPRSSVVTFSVTLFRRCSSSFRPRSWSPSLGLRCSNFGAMWSKMS